jgi:hypothetical protein
MPGSTMASASILFNTVREALRVGCVTTGQSEPSTAHQVLLAQEANNSFQVRVLSLYNMFGFQGIARPTFSTSRLITYHR